MMKEFRLKLYDEFECIGTKCPWTCCGGWKISIEKETIDKYKAVPGPLSQELLDSLMFDENGCAYIKFNDEGFCPLLNEKRLCRVYLEAGEGTMSTVCRVYPRGEYIFGDIYLKYICISCPEMARMLFCQDMPLEFDIKENDRISVNTDAEFNWDKFNLLTRGMISTIDIMQTRDIHIATRLQLALLFNNEFQRALKSGSDVASVIDTFSNEQTLELIIDEVSNLSARNDLYENFVLELSRRITGIGETELVFIIDYIKEALGDFQACEDKRKVSFRQFLDSEDNKIVFENFCVYYVMRHYLECFNEDNPYDYMVNMVQLCAVYAWLFGAYRSSRRSMEEYTVIVAMLSRKIEHSQAHTTAYDAILRELCDLGMGEVDFLLKLLG